MQAAVGKCIERGRGNELNAIRAGIVEVDRVFEARGGLAGLNGFRGDGKDFHRGGEATEVGNLFPANIADGNILCRICRKESDGTRETGEAAFGLLFLLRGGFDGIDGDGDGSGADGDGDGAAGFADRGTGPIDVDPDACVLAGIGRFVFLDLNPGLILFDFEIDGLAALGEDLDIGPLTAE